MSHMLFTCKNFVFSDLTWKNLLPLFCLRRCNDKDPKFKFGYHVRISKYKNIFAKGYFPNWSGETFMIKLKY